MKNKLPLLLTVILCALSLPLFIARSQEVIRQRNEVLETEKSFRSLAPNQAKTASPDQADITLISGEPVNGAINAPTPGSCVLQGTPQYIINVPFVARPSAASIRQAVQWART